jgi:hypothetical protein
VTGTGSRNYPVVGVVIGGVQTTGRKKRRNEESSKQLNKNKTLGTSGPYLETHGSSPHLFYSISLI